MLKKIAYFGLFVAIATLMSCKFDRPKEKIAEIDNGQIKLANGQVQAIEGVGDTSKTVFIIVRHGESADKEGKADLSDAGKHRSASLVNFLSKMQIERVCITNSKASLATAQPIAEAQHCPTTTFTAQVIEPFLEDAIATGRGKTYVLVGPSNVMVGVLNFFSPQPIYKDTDIPEAEHDNLYVVSATKKGVAKIVEFKY